MYRLILLNHENGESFESFNASDMEKIIAEQVEEGADIENLSMYRAETIRIKEVTTTKTRYKFEKCK